MTVTNLYYDPYRQGFDLNLWRYYGAIPTAVPNGMSIVNSAIIHYGDARRGHFSFSVMVLDNLTTEDVRIGLVDFGTNSFIGFQISGGSFAAIAISGTDSTSTALTWNTAWNSTFASFGIRWEAGTAKYFVNGVQMAAITSVAVTGSPLSMYVKNNSATPVYVGNILAKAMQTFSLNPVPSTITGGIFPDIILPSASPVFDLITITENINLLVIVRVPSVFDTVTVSENINLLVPAVDVPSVFDTVTVSENKVLIIV